MELSRYLSKANISHSDFVAALAERGVKVTTQAIRNWIEVKGSNARKPSPKKVHAIEAATGGAVTRHDLRPDVYGKPPRPTPFKKRRES